MLTSSVFLYFCYWFDFFMLLILMMCVTPFKSDWFPRWFMSRIDHLAKICWFAQFPFSSLCLCVRVFVLIKIAIKSKQNQQIKNLKRKIKHTHEKKTPTVELSVHREWNNKKYTHTHKFKFFGHKNVLSQLMRWIFIDIYLCVCISSLFPLLR